jgi:hypothetical protein
VTLGKDAKGDIRGNIENRFVDLEKRLSSNLRIGVVRHPSKPKIPRPMTSITVSHQYNTLQ